MWNSFGPQKIYLGFFLYFKHIWPFTILQIWKYFIKATECLWSFRWVRWSQVRLLLMLMLMVNISNDDGGGDANGDDDSDCMLFADSMWRPNTRAQGTRLSFWRVRSVVTVFIIIVLSSISSSASSSRAISIISQIGLPGCRGEANCRGVRRQMWGDCSQTGQS